MLTLTAAYFILKYQIPYKDPGIDYHERGKETRIKASLVRKLEHLGYHVILTDADKAAAS
jgi:hypothetical protein